MEEKKEQSLAVAFVRVAGLGGRVRRQPEQQVGLGLATNTDSVRQLLRAHWRFRISHPFYRSARRCQRKAKGIVVFAVHLLVRPLLWVGVLQVEAARVRKHWTDTYPLNWGRVTGVPYGLDGKGWPGPGLSSANCFCSRSNAASACGADERCASSMCFSNSETFSVLSGNGLGTEFGVCAATGVGRL